MTKGYELSSFQLLTAGLYSGDDVKIRVNYMVECKTPWVPPFLWRIKAEIVLDGQRGYRLDDVSGRWGGKDGWLITVSGKMPSGRPLRGKIIFRAGFWVGFPPLPPLILQVFDERPITIANMDDVTPPPTDGERPAVCTEGQTRCEGLDLYVCRNNQWIIQEYNSKTCGYMPPALCSEGDEVCSGNDLKVCQGGQWVLKEKNSPRCGYVPPGGGDGVTPPIDGQGGVVGWFERNKKVIIAASAVALAIAITLLLVRRRYKFQKPVEFHKPVVRKEPGGGEE